MIFRNNKINFSIGLLILTLLFLINKYKFNLVCLLHLLFSIAVVYQTFLFIIKLISYVRNKHHNINQLQKILLIPNIGSKVIYVCFFPTMLIDSTMLGHRDK